MIIVYQQMDKAQQEKKTLKRNQIEIPGLKYKITETKNALERFNGNWRRQKKGSVNLKTGQ